jgi:hypothetical protein
MGEPLICSEEGIENRRFWAIRLRVLSQDARTLLTLSCAQVPHEQQQMVIVRRWDLTAKSRLGGKTRPQITAAIEVGNCADCAPPYATTPDVRMVAFVYSGQKLRICDTIAGTYSELLSGTMGSSARLALSPDGQWLALTSSAAQPSSKQTQFVVLDTEFKQKPRLASLDGYFLFDGLNNSGSSLFLTESLGSDPSEKYQVRRYNLASGALDPNVIVDKLEGTTIMSGVRQTAVTSQNGDWLYSLYLNPSHGPFIHALPISDMDTSGLAFCIDLPTNGKDDLA